MNIKNVEFLYSMREKTALHITGCKPNVGGL